MDEHKIEIQESIDEWRSVTNVEKISQLHQKRKTFVILDSGRFLGNIKHFVNYLLEKSKKSDEFYFVTFSKENHELVRKLGIESLLLSDNKISKREFMILLECSIVVTDSTLSFGNWPGPPLALAALNGAKWIQMWHGIPMKKIEFENLPNQIENKNFADGYLLRTKSVHTFIGTTRKDKKMYKRSFGFTKYRPFGYARNDCLRRNLLDTDLVNSDIKSFNQLLENRRVGKRSFLYAPTFRDDASDGWLEFINLQKLADVTQEKGDELFIALHPYDVGKYEKLIGIIDNAVLIDPSLDIYPLLKNFDLVISDYSSLMFDLLHVPIPQVMFLHDLERYRTQSREIDFQIMTQPVGPIVESIEALIGCIYVSKEAFNRKYSASRKRLLSERFKYKDSNASRRLIRYIRRTI